MEKLRSRARQATTDFLDTCDAMRLKAKSKDEDALRKIDVAIVSFIHVNCRKSIINRCVFERKQIIRFLGHKTSK